MVDVYRFYTPVELIFGWGCSALIGEKIKDAGCEKVLLVTDKGVESAGITEPIKAALNEHKIEFVVYDGVQANPTEDNVHAGSELIKRNRCDGVLAVGGGSPIDAAKAMSMLSVHEGSIIDYEYGKKAIAKKGPPVFIIPTTAGTGSEATYWSVITDQKKKRKFDVGSPLMAARLSLVDPQLTVTLPALTTAATGMDALCHAIEAFTTKNAYPATDSLALVAVEKIAENIVPAFQNGADRHARSEMMLASMTAGMAFPNAGLGAVHGLTAPLGGHFNIPHGIANAIMLPFVMQFNCRSCAEKYETLAEVMGGGGCEAEAAIEKVWQLRKTLGIPVLSEFGVSQADVDVLAADALGPNSNCNSNPRHVSIADARTLYLAALEEKR